MKPDFVLYADIYDVQVAIFSDRKRCTAYCREKELEPLFEEITAKWEAASGSPKDKNGLTWFVGWIPKATRPEKVAHECLHLAWMILDHHSIEINCSNHEALAYLMDNLIAQYNAKARRRKLH